MESGASLRRSHPPGAVFGEWRAPDGWLHRRMDWPQPEARPARGSLIFAGGRGDFIEKYLEIHAHWHSAGWYVSAFDWRGQGGSRGDMVGGNYNSFDPLVDDMAALIEDVRSRGQGPCVAVGHSMGGHLLLRTLVDRKPGLDAAVLVAPMILVNSAPLPPWAAPGIAEAMCLAGLGGRPVWKAPPALARPGSRRQYLLTGCAERYSDELWWWEKEPGFSLGAPSWSWMRAAYRSAARAFTPRKLAQVDAPVLLLGTDRDRLVSPAEIRRTASLLPRAELKMFADAGHEILREADPIRLEALARIDSFLDEHAR